MRMKKMLNEGNQIHNLISSSGTGTVINYGSGSDFLTSYCSGSGSTSQQVTVPTVPVLVPQRCVEEFHLWYLGAAHGPAGVGDGEIGPGVLVVAQVPAEYHVIALQAQRQLLLNVLPANPQGVLRDVLKYDRRLVIASSPQFFFGLELRIGQQCLLYR
jgi:hypothetical protein